MSTKHKYTGHTISNFIHVAKVYEPLEVKKPNVQVKRPMNIKDVW